MMVLCYMVLVQHHRLVVARNGCRYSLEHSEGPGTVGEGVGVSVGVGVGVGVTVGGAGGQGR